MAVSIRLLVYKTPYRAPAESKRWIPSCDQWIGSEYFLSLNLISFSGRRTKGRRRRGSRPARSVGAMSLVPARRGNCVRNIAAQKEIERSPARQRLSRTQEKDHPAPRIFTWQRLETFRNTRPYPSPIKLPDRVVPFPAGESPGQYP